MAHGVELEVTERNLLHLTVGGVVFDPVLVLAKAIARIESRRVLVGDACQFIETATGEDAKSTKVRMQLLVNFGREIEREKLLQTMINGVEVLARTVRRYGRDTFRPTRIASRSK